MTKRLKLFTMTLLAFGLAWGHVSDARATGVRVDGPGLVLIVDGIDRQTTERTFNIDLTVPVARYDFGFVDTYGFTSFTLAQTGPSSFVGTYTFTGGDLVNFALRDNVTTSIYSITDPVDYADQIYFLPIDPSKSANPVVTFPYYNTLVLEWDLDHNGFNLLTDAGLTLTQAKNAYDGLAPMPAVVPLPATVLLFGTGLMGMVGRGSEKDRVMRSLVRGLMVVVMMCVSGAPAMAATVTQLNITGGSVNLDFGALGSISGSFQQSGTLVMGTFQPPPDILPPVMVDGHTFSLSTQPAGGLFNAPSGQTAGTTMTADLSSLFAMISGPSINGSLNIGGLASGTYDPLSGQFSLSWTHVFDISSANFGLEGNADVAPVPLPAAVGFFATGVLGLWAAAKRRVAEPVSGV